MRAKDAFEAMQNGEKVRRKGWRGTLQIDSVNGSIVYMKGCIMRTVTRVSDMNLVDFLDMVLAEDYEIVKTKSKASASKSKAADKPNAKTDTGSDVKAMFDQIFNGSLAVPPDTKAKKKAAKSAKPTADTEKKTEKKIVKERSKKEQAAPKSNKAAKAKK